MNENKKIELNWPEVSYDTTDWEHTIIQNKLIAFVAIHQDQDAMNPCKEWDGVGQIRSLSRDHIDNISVEEIESMLEDPINKEQMIPLSYFEHGNCIWGVKGTMNQMPDFKWDGTDFAGVWIPDKECIASVNHLEKESKDKEFNRNEEFKKMAAQACETYTSFCNGEVYGFRIELYRLQTDPKQFYIEDQSYYECNVDQLWEDSCWGFFGNDIEHMKNTIADNLLCHLKSMKAESAIGLEYPDYSKMKQEDFDRILGTLVSRDASTLLTIPGIYEVVSEHYNNEILTEWEKEQLK